MSGNQGAPAGGEDLDAEIEAAFGGTSMQELDLDPRARGRRPSGQREAESEKRLFRGKVAGISGNDVIVELGPRTQGVIGLDQFEEPPRVGQTFEFAMRGQEDGLWILSLDEALVLAQWRDLDVGSLVKARVTGQNTGGLELKVGGISAFMPASHVSLKREEDISTYIGETLVCEVLEVDAKRKRALLSRRRVLEHEREEQRGELMRAIEPGRVVRGKVSRIEPFGAFVTIGGTDLEGLLHVSNMAHTRVQDPNDAVKVGQELELLVLEVKEGGKRIGLGLKQLQPDPWDDVAERYRPDQIVHGKVTRLAAFGAFVELEPGVEGLLHISQLGLPRNVKTHKALSVGDEVDVRVLSVDPHEQRIAFSRLDSRGALLGSEEAAEAADIDAVLDQSTGSALGTNLGALFRKALDGGR